MLINISNWSDRSKLTPSASFPQTDSSVSFSFLRFLFKTSDLPLCLRNIQQKKKNERFQDSGSSVVFRTSVSAAGNIRAWPGDYCFIIKSSVLLDFQSTVIFGMYSRAEIRMMMSELFWSVVSLRIVLRKSNSSKLCALPFIWFSSVCVLQLLCLFFFFLSTSFLFQEEGRRRLTTENVLYNSFIYFF